VRDFNLTFYFDLLTPVNETDPGDGLELVRTRLLENLALQFGITTGTRCRDPPFDGSSWVVRLISEMDQYSRVELFGKFVKNNDIFVAVMSRMVCWKKSASLSNGMCHVPTRNLQGIEPSRRPRLSLL
jgi:hypothetical protein